MLKLNFPSYSFRFKNKENKGFIFDPIRKKFVVLTPEEWVRQHVIQFLVQEHRISTALISVEKQLKLNETTKRYDIVVYNRDASVYLIVECKAPQITITQETFDQIARYNMVVDSDFLMVTNGLEHFFCKIDYLNKKYQFVEGLL